VSLLNNVEQTPSDGNARRGILVGLGVGALVIAVYFVASTMAPNDLEVEEIIAPSSDPTPAPVIPFEPEPAPEPEPEPPRPTPIFTPEPAPEPEPETPAASAPLRLRVTSDVANANVFIDRRFVGKTPFESADIAPGPHRINVSVSGQEGHAEDVEIGERLTEIAVQFLTVRLDQSITTLHKHRFGNCSGRLVADLNSIHYQTDHDDAFTIKWENLEEFAIDYLEHNLRVTQRGGRTYNFTDHEENADALFVFHRNVEAARARLVTRPAL
jgi:hypothetical protein